MCACGGHGGFSEEGRYTYRWAMCKDISFGRPANTTTCVQTPRKSRVYVKRERTPRMSNRCSPFRCARQTHQAAPPSLQTQSRMDSSCTVLEWKTPSIEVYLTVTGCENCARSRDFFQAFFNTSRPNASAKRVGYVSILDPLLR